MAATAPASGYVLAVRCDQGLPIAPERQEGGQPVRRFRKELIRTGQYIKPSEGLDFQVNQKTLDHWAAVFSEMRSNGVRVPIPAGHITDDMSAAAQAEANRGWLVDLFREGDSLIGIIDLVGDGIKLAGTTNVSIYSPSKYIDGKGNRYDWPITHVALCVDPVIPGLEGFVSIAAAHGQPPARVPVLTLQEGITMSDPAMNPDAAVGSSKPSDAIKESFKTAVHAVIDDDSLDVAGKIKKIKAILQAQEKALGLFDSGTATSTPAVSDAAEVTVPMVAASLNPMLVRLAAENYGHKLAKLVEGGRITPAVRNKLAAEFIGADRRALALSLSAGENGCDHFDAVLAALADNDPVSLGEQTRGQSLELSNPFAGDAADPEAKRMHDEMKASACRMAGMKAK